MYLPPSLHYHISPLSTISQLYSSKNLISLSTFIFGLISSFSTKRLCLFSTNYQYDYFSSSPINPLNLSVVFYYSYKSSPWQTRPDVPWLHFPYTRLTSLLPWLSALLVRCPLLSMPCSHLPQGHDRNASLPSPITLPPCSTLFSPFKS